MIVTENYSWRNILLLYSIYKFYSALLSFIQVSRCGVVFLESRSLGWIPLVHAWQCQLPSIIQEVNKHEIMSLFMRFCPILLWFIRSGGVEVSLFRCMSYFSAHFS